MPDYTPDEYELELVRALAYKQIVEHSIPIELAPKWAKPHGCTTRMTKSVTANTAKRSVAMTADNLTNEQLEAAALGLTAEQGGQNDE